MSDDFGTVNVGRADRAREIEVLRKQYRSHRDALSRMAADAPTEHLAGEYQRLGAELDLALRKLDELDGRATSPGLTPLPSPHRPASPRTSPGDRPLVADPRAADPQEEEPTVIGEPFEPRPNSGSRVAIIVGVGVLVLAAIVFLIWRGSEKGAGAATPVGEQQSTIAPLDTAPAPVTQTTAAAANGLKITPALADYGTIRKGTRAVRQFEVTNKTASPITLLVARSVCRCLYYDYHGKVAPNAKETLTVTIDGAKAKAGSLRETLAVKAKEDRSLTSEITVEATIK